MVIDRADGRLRNSHIRHKRSPQACRELGKPALSFLSEAPGRMIAPTPVFSTAESTAKPERPSQWARNRISGFPSSVLA